MNTKSLEEAGLTKGEIKVYLALLETGSSTIGPILKESKITKSIIYRILEKLIEKGLASYIIKEKTKYYEAATPNKLLDYVENREKEFKKNKNEIQKIIPQLMIKKTLKENNKATIYQGFKGLMTAYENRYLKLKKGDEVVLYGLPSKQPGFHHAYWKKHHIKLSKLGIKCRMLYHSKVSNEILKNRNSYKDCNAKKIPFNIESPSWVMIYKDIVLIAIPQGELPIAIEIENEKIANSFKNYFEYFWKQSK